jgi:hypothetical protein
MVVANWSIASALKIPGAGLFATVVVGLTAAARLSWLIWKFGQYDVARWEQACGKKR